MNGYEWWKDPNAICGVMFVATVCVCLILHAWRSR